MPEKPPTGLLGPLKSSHGRVRPRTYRSKADRVAVERGAEEARLLMARAERLVGRAAPLPSLNDTAMRLLGAERAQLIEDRINGVPGAFKREVNQAHHDVEAMFRAGSSIAAIAAAADYTRTYVRRILRKRGALE